MPFQMLRLMLRSFTKLRQEMHHSRLRWRCSRQCSYLLKSYTANESKFKVIPYKIVLLDDLLVTSGKP